MNEMVIYSSDEYVVNYVDTINNKYKLLGEDEKERIHEKYSEFIKEFK